MAELAFVLMPYLNNHIPLVVDTYNKVDRATADLAVFDVCLLFF
jgi:hypothetical protein